MHAIFATRKQPTFAQLKRHLHASLRQTIRRKAALKGLEVRKAKVIFVTP